MSSQQLYEAARLRRQEIFPYINQVVQGKVYTGPFKGMTLLPSVFWGDGDFGSKLLGIYEDELHPFITDAVSNQPDLVINVGCAEGYYAIGMARLLPDSAVIAVDVDHRGAKICQDNSEANQTTNVEVVLKNVDVAWLSKKLIHSQNPLLIVDCEGAELELLDLSKIPDLSKASIIVECHDVIISGITETLKTRFQGTHDIVHKEQSYKDPYQFDFLRQFSDCDKWAIVHEGRPSTMGWLYMTPKK